MKHLGKLLPMTCLLILMAQPAGAASKLEVETVINSLKTLKGSEFNILGKKGVRYEKALGPLLVNGKGYSNVKVVFEDYEGQEDELNVFGVLEASNKGARLHGVSDGGEGGPLDGTPDRSFNKFFSLNELAGIIKDALSGSYSKVLALKKYIRKPNSVDRTLYDRAIKKALDY